MPLERFLENKHLNTREFEEKAEVLSSKFTSLICALENRCNIRCIMCGTWKEPWSLPEKTFREVMDALPYLEHAVWVGGEVFLSPYFNELLEETKKYPYLEQRINTNALLIDENWAGKLARNNVELICSIDAGTKGTYEYIRKGGRFEDLLKSLSLVREAAAKHGERKLRLRMNTVVMKSNYRELGRLLDFAREQDFESVQLIEIKGGDDEQIFTDTPENRGIAEELRTILPTLSARAGEYGIELMNCLPLSAAAKDTASHPAGKARKNSAAVSEECFCRLPWQQLMVMPFGHTLFGCWCPESLGNILTHSLADLWNSETARKYRRNIARNAYHEFCDKRCVFGEVPAHMRKVDEFEKKHGKRSL